MAFYMENQPQNPEFMKTHETRFPMFINRIKVRDRMIDLKYYLLPVRFPFKCQVVRAPITQYMQVCNKNSNTQGSSPYVLIVIFHTLRNCFSRREFAPSGIKFFPVREVPILKMDIIVENHCLIQ